MVMGLLKRIGDTTKKVADAIDQAVMDSPRFQDMGVLHPNRRRRQEFIDLCTNMGLIYAHIRDIRTRLGPDDEALTTFREIKLHQTLPESQDYMSGRKPIGKTTSLKPQTYDGFRVTDSGEVYLIM